jgi:acetoin utilization deacetylase AcuC-like enzyme
MNGKADNAFALIRPPGHHATKNRSMGFCLFNNAAIAANEISKHDKKVLIFDFDVHHGNGTQDIFFDRNDVMYQSFHLSPHYPGTGDIKEIGIGEGEGYTINLPLSYGAGNNAVKKIFDKIFIPIAFQFNPDLIIVSSGYDSHNQDPLGGMKLTSNFYGEMTKRLMDVQSNIVCTLEGGYNLKWIGKCMVSQLAKMSNNKLIFDDIAEEYGEVDSIIENLKNELKSIWEV